MSPIPKRVHRIMMIVFALLCIGLIFGLSGQGQIAVYFGYGALCVAALWALCVGVLVWDDLQQRKRRMRVL